MKQTPNVPMDPDAPRAAAPATDTDAAFARLYASLERSARRVLRGSGTLDAPALVSEAYLRLDGHGPWESTRHFYAVACRAMGQVVMNHHRDAHRQRRGGGVAHITICDDGHGRVPLAITQFIDLQDALDLLEARTPRLAAVVTYRAIGGLSVEETAEALDVSPATVKRDWKTARAFLARYLAEHDTPDALPDDPATAAAG